MGNKQSIEAFYQIPKSLLKEPKLTGDHLFIFMILHDDLRQKTSTKKTNKKLCELTRIGLRQLKLRLNELEAWGFINRIGMGINREIIYGEKFYNGAESEPVQRENRAESEPVVGGKGTSNWAESELVIYNNLIKNINKKRISFKKMTTQEQKQEILYYLKNPQFVMRKELQNLIIMDPV